MAGTVSVSKGVFAFKRPKHRSQRHAPRLSTLDHWGHGYQEEREENFKQLTHLSYTSCWNIASQILQELQDNIHSKVFQSLVTYIDSAGRRLTADITTTRDQTFGLTHALGNVPTACLVTGVNMPDRDATFQSLVGLLRSTSRRTSPPCRVKSAPRAAMYRMISQLIGGGGWAGLQDEEEEEEVVTGPKVKRKQCTMAVLAAWYQRTHPSSPRKAKKEPPGYTRSPTKTPCSPSKGNRSPTKRTHPSSSRKADKDTQANEGSPSKRIKSNIIASLPERSDKPPIVIILEDLESFPPRVLNDLVLICSQYRATVPVVLVFGVATTPDRVHHSLSHHASACLAMEVFRAQPSTHYLTSVIDKVLMSNELPFHLGGRPFKLLLDIFLYNDLSVENFTKGLKVCMMEHFMCHASSFLCCSPKHRQDMLGNVTGPQLDTVRKLPSFRAYVEAAPPQEQVPLLIDEDYTKKTILSLLAELDVWYARFCALVKVANALTSRLPGAPMGRQVREVLAVCLSRSLVDTEEYQEAVKGLRSMAREELVTVMQCVQDVLEEQLGGDEILCELLTEVILLSGRLSGLGQTTEAEDEKEAGGGGAAVTLKPSDRFHLREKLLDSAKNKGKKSNKYECLRSEVVQFFSDAFASHLQPPTTQTLHEVLFFHSSRAAKKMLVGLPRPALTTALANPHHYLQCDCCRLDEPSALVTTLPDISVAYKLHLECGRHINLFDWLQAFVAVVSQEDDEEGPVTSSRNVDQKLQARFVLAVSELQFLGFIKPTKRKTDHMVRLTWGGC
ncbi:Origin recognition complex subunit 3 [Chionoecetes opilio]|uniref:Origin recognition complex subunit 3 n=1 Tax=Chionoecetes opilio TaxID=41210 RepID=A0A8J4YCX8_CHIOP|nr:Origin recognition complex subunit 3 [Chionoecetes opilio]